MREGYAVLCCSVNIKIMLPTIENRLTPDSAPRKRHRGPAPRYIKPHPKFLNPTSKRTYRGGDSGWQFPARCFEQASKRQFSLLTLFAEPDLTHCEMGDLSSASPIGVRTAYFHFVLRSESQPVEISS